MSKKLLIVFFISCMYVLTAYAGDLAGPHMTPDTASNASEAANNNRESVYQSVFMTLEESVDYEEIRALEGEVLKHAETLIRGRDYVLTADDIDWSKAFVAYSMTPEMYEENLDLEKFYAESDYIWVIPLYVDGMTLEMTFNKRRELTDNARARLSDEEIASWEKTVGKWVVIGGGRYDEIIDFKGEIAWTLEANGFSEDCHSFQLGGLFGISMPLVVVVEDGKPEYIFPAREMHKKIFAEKTNARAIADCASTFIYSYDEVMEASKNYLENYVSKEGVLGFSDIEHLDIEPIHMGK